MQVNLSCTMIPRLERKVFIELLFLVDCLAHAGVLKPLPLLVRRTRQPLFVPLKSPSKAPKKLQAWPFKPAGTVPSNPRGRRILVLEEVPPTTRVECFPCTSGSYSSAEQNGGLECLLCPAGTYQTENASSTCKACQPGNYSSRTGSLGCLKCEPGKFADDSMLPECKPCPAGFFVAREGSQSCLPCAR